MLAPDHLYQTVLSDVKNNPKKALSSECPMTVHLARVALKHPTVENAVTRAYEIFSRKRNSRILMESLLFCQESKQELIEKIAQHLELHVDVPKIFSQYFFDVDIFKDKLDRIDYLEQLRINNPNDENQYMLKDTISKQLAMTEGFSYTIGHFNATSFDYTPIEFTKKLLNIAQKYIVQAKESSILSVESDKLLKWVTVAERLSITLKNLRDGSGEDALQDIRMALEFDKPPEDLNKLPPESVIRG